MTIPLTLTLSATIIVAIVVLKKRDNKLDRQISDLNKMAWGDYYLKYYKRLKI